MGTGWRESPVLNAGAARSPRREPTGLVRSGPSARGPAPAALRCAAGRNSGPGADARSVRIEGNVQGSVVNFGPPPGGGAAPERSVEEALYPALLRVRGRRDEPIGAGFLVGPRLALTCAHVLEKARAPDGTVRVDFPFLAPNSPQAACPVRESPEADVAVLELTEDPPPGAAPVALKEGSDLWGHSFRAFGFPEGHPDGVWASGVIRGPDARGRLQIEDPKEAGFR
ncbi:MAG: serine protease, partial [Anaerolineae bacterium]|nr:serine protease [Anaerolineae bacterium]